MKILAIDAGNTRVKWGTWEDGQWARQGVTLTAEASRLPEELGAVAAIDRAVIANVADEHVAHVLREALPAHLRTHWVVGQTEQCGVRSSYAEATQLGPDRWAALIGARHLYSGPCVVVNAGTTMTVDALSGEAVFLGGFIVPGFELMRRALATHTARLPLVAGEFRFFPDNTADAITSGALNALAGAVERMCRYIAQAGEGEPIVVLSGGDAPLLAPPLNATHVVDNLVLEGLVRIGMSDG